MWVLELHCMRMAKSMQIFCKKSNKLCPNIPTTPLRQWGFRQCLPFSWTTPRDKLCRHPIAVMGVVDTFGLSRNSKKLPKQSEDQSFCTYGRQRPAFSSSLVSVNIHFLPFFITGERSEGFINDLCTLEHNQVIPTSFCRCWEQQTWDLRSRKKTCFNFFLLEWFKNQSCLDVSLFWFILTESFNWIKWVSFWQLLSYSSKFEVQTGGC